ncbi:MAG: hypothetical protein D6743_00430 [Calditrichaeota bacterium]|nr:MAG: hypothetical protein D6743_00430 [Calditrichota bacterium]
MSLQHALDTIRKDHKLIFLLAVSEDGLVVAQSGETPEDSFAPYAPMAVETARRMAKSGGFDEPVCSALILQDGRMLILYQTVVVNRVLYLALLCTKVPAGLKGVLQRIAEEIGSALGETGEKSS